MLLTEVDGKFDGTARYDNGFERTWMLGPTNTSRAYPIYQLLTTHGASGDKIIRITGAPFQSFVRIGSGGTSVAFFALIDAKLVE